jgi:glycosyltransferase involved in cell wall biosynthesis
MKRILINSHSYSPRVGGSESACELLAEGFSERGLEVIVVTTVPGPVPHSGLLRIVRQPSRGELLRLIRWADVVIHSNISLRAAWPLLFCLRPWIVIHHTSLGAFGFRGLVKQLAAFLAKNISVSKALAGSLLTRSDVLGNGYRDHVFKPLPEISRDRHLIFVGRLVSTKGASLALQALAKLRKTNSQIELTIVGDGPERKNLAALAKSLEVAGAVRFTGILTPNGVAEELNRHQVLLAPSIVTETFGLVVLEAIACGCVPVVSDVGGLPESIGQCGFVVREGSVGQLVNAAEQLLSHPEERAAKLQLAGPHLARFRSDVVIDTYLKVIGDVRKTRVPMLSWGLFSFLRAWCEGW